MGPEIALIATVASTVVGFAGQMMQGQAQADAAKYQAAVARNNQIAAQQNAAYATQAGAVASQASDRKNAAIAGAILAGQGASGIDIESTTSKEVRASQEQLGRLDTATIMNKALLTARGYTAEASNFGAESQLDMMKASNASTAGMIGGFTSLLGGATSFADKWSKYQLAGVGVSPAAFGDWSPRY